MEISLERLLGRRVVDAEGHPVGRLEEARAERRDGELVVVEWVLGTGGLLERLGVTAVGRTVLGRWVEHEPRAIAWSDLDVSDPERPRLRRR